MTYLQVTPLTSLKFAEFVVKAGFPPGVVNILPGSGTMNIPCCSGVVNTPVICTRSCCFSIPYAVNFIYAAFISSSCHELELNWMILLTRSQDNQVALPGIFDEGSLKHTVHFPA